MSTKKLFFGLAALGVILTGVWLAAQGSAPKDESIQLLNVSYDVSRELWIDLNEAYLAEYERRSGEHPKLTIKQSHGGSGSQARSVVDGLDADVVTLNLFTDTDLLRKKGMIPAGWEERLPNRSLPYTSTIVFVVRQGNPKNVHDWPDLLQPGVEVITPNPKTSGNGKLSFLAAWGSVTTRGGSEDDAGKFVAELFARIPVLDTGGRGATITFSQKEIGDVHLAWENEAHLEVQESQGKLELVYPPVSIQAEPHVAVVDANVDRKGTRTAAEEYLSFLYTDAAQEIIAKHFYRPINEEVRNRHQEKFPPIELFSVTAVAPDWDAAYTRFFAEGALFDRLYKPFQNR